MRLGLYHERAGTRHAGGIAVYVRRMAEAVARATDHEAVLFTRDGDLADPLSDAAVSVVALPPPADSLSRLARRLPGPARRPPASRRLPGRLAVPGKHSVLRRLPDRASALRRLPGQASVLRRLPGQASVLRRLSVPRPGGQRADKLATFAAAVASGRLDAADVVVTHQYLDDLLVSWACPVPTVYQYHGLRRVGAGGRARERLSATRWHLANSRQTAREAREKLGRTVDGVVRPGVDARQFSPAAEPAFDRERPVVLFVGRLVESKGVFDLLAAVARLSTDAHLRLVGRGDADAVRDRARALGVADAVTVAGPVPHGDLPGQYAAADVACVPARYESFGMANLEAMACGLPVVATEACGLAGVDRGAVLVPPGDVPALARRLDDLLADPGRRAALGAAGREVARGHDWARQAGRLASFCERVVRESG